MAWLAHGLIPEIRAFFDIATALVEAPAGLQDILIDVDTGLVQPLSGSQWIAVIIEFLAWFVWLAAALDDVLRARAAGDRKDAGNRNQHEPKSFLHANLLSEQMRVRPHGVSLLACQRVSTERMNVFMVTALVQGVRRAGGSPSSQGLSSAAFHRPRHALDHELDSEPAGNSHVR